MPRVYIINKSRHDFTAAQEFGEFVYLSNGLIHKYATNRHTERFKELLKDSKADDYLLLTSVSVLNVIAAVIMMSLHGKLNLLLYNPKDSCYVHRVIKLDRQEKIL